MFLTRIILNPRDPRVISLMRNRQKMHGSITSIIPSYPVTPEEGRVLWRLDYDDPYKPIVYLLSPTVPEVTEESNFKFATFNTKNYSSLLNSLKEDQTFAFRLTANTSHSGRKSEGEDTKRFGHLTVMQQLGWLTDRTKKHGFEILNSSTDNPNVKIIARQKNSFWRQQKKVTLVLATFEGQLRVIDLDVFRKALIKGIGPAKAYGCGLITLSPRTR